MRMHYCGLFTINAFDTYPEHSKNEGHNSDFLIQRNIPEKRNKPKETNLNNNT